MAKIEPEVKFLQNKQRNLLLAQGLSAPAGPEDLYRILNDSSTSLNSEQIAQGRAAIKRLSTYKPPSKFQDIQTYALMVDLADKIRSTADAMGLRIPSEPLLASFASGQVNALTIHVPKARRSLVVFEDQMFTFANLFAKVLGQTIVFVGEDEDGPEFSLEHEAMAEQIRSRPEILQRFWEALIAYVVSGRPSEAPQYYLWGPPSMIGALFREGLELFVMGHEFGHIIKSHNSRARQTMLLLDDEEVETIEWNWQQEHAADGIGMVLAVGALRENYDLALSFAGADLFFSLLELLDRALSLLTTGDENNVRVSPTHPPPAARREAVHDLLYELVEKPEDAEAAIALTDHLREALELLWHPCRDRLLTLHAQGATPDRRWMTALREA